MENSAKALYIAGSLLIALLVVSLLVYTFNNLGKVQEQKDEIEYEESITAFNKEYEAFDKKIMYGVDVISCINKAVSNNEKYVKAGRWASGGASGEEALVQVEVKMNNDTLKESVECYYFENGKERKYVGNASFPDSINNMKWSDILHTYSDSSLPKFTAINKNDTLPDLLKNKNIEMEIDSNNFNLLEESNGKLKKDFNEDDASLYTLVKNISELDIIIRNPNGESDYGNWSYIKWTTCLSDFKKRKFECSEIIYNENTGRIDHIKFKEK